jgi:hypothetical protein
MSKKCYQCGRENFTEGTICADCRVAADHPGKAVLPGSDWKDGLIAGASAGASVGFAVAMFFGICGTGLTGLFAAAQSSNHAVTASQAGAGLAIGAGLTLTVMAWAFFSSLLEISLLGVLCGALGKLADRNETIKYGLIVGVVWALATHTGIVSGAFWGFAGAAFCHSVDKKRRGY